MSGLETSAFLGVEHSVSGQRWTARLDRAGEAQALAIAQAHGIADVVARVLAGRGVRADHAPAYLNPTLRELMPDPLTLRDMDLAVDRLARAILTGEQIAVFGDYDVDGACSAAMLAQFLEAAGAPTPFIHIPDRILEGYGPNVEAARELFRRGARLMVTVDCGSTSFEALDAARALGLDVIVLDHHQVGELLPQGVIVNPNRQDDLSDAGALCAAGVVFLALAALSRALRRQGHWTSARPEPELLEALDLVALATVADVAPLTGLNRAFVAKGLAVMRQRGRAGLAALMDAARLDGPPRAYHLGFLLGPRINAGGRIGDAALGARLLSLRDPVEARSVAQRLDRLNAERQRLEEVALERAILLAEHQLEAQGEAACLTIWDQDFLPGLVGILASRLKDRFKIPSFVFVSNNDLSCSSTGASSASMATGSGRSVVGADIGRAVRKAVELKLAVKGGGHKMAAGATVACERLPEFAAFMQEEFAAALGARRDANVLRVDAALTARGASLPLAEMLERAGPYGQGAAEPIFVFPQHGVEGVTLVGANHLRLRLRSGDGAALDAICFRAAETALGDALRRGCGSFHVAARLAKDVYRGREKVSAQIVDLAPAG